jgi:predicted component of type VI protein secretion system
MEIAEMLGYRVDPDACVARLVAGYAVKPEDKRVATTLLRKYAKYVERGKISQPVSKLFRYWWEI